MCYKELDERFVAGALVSLLDATRGCRKREACGGRTIGNWEQKGVGQEVETAAA